MESNVVLIKSRGVECMLAFKTKFELGLAFGSVRQNIACAASYVACYARFVDQK